MVDNTDVVLSYSHPPTDWRKLNGKRVFAIGRIHRSIPKEEICFQRLLLPHMTEVKCLIELIND